MPPTIFKLLAPRFRSKIASFDYDHTLVIPKEGRNFSKDVNDYMWLTPHVPNVIKALYKKGFMIIIFTNQSKQWKADQIKAAMEELQIPVTIAIAFDKSEYKPNTILFDTIIGTKAFNKKASFFVGDALGRKGDWSDSDAKFGEAIGIKTLAPEALFAKKASDAQVLAAPKLLPVTHPEVVIMTGYPGSGKSTIAMQLTVAPNYVLLSGDKLKTPAKMIKAANDALKVAAAAASPSQKPKSIIFDATNPSKEKRATYIEFAKKHNMPVRCVWVSTPIDTSYQQNLARPEDQRVPRIVYNIYKKHFIEPSHDEGCEIIKL